MLKRITEKSWFTNIIPITALVVMLIVFLISTNGLYLSSSNIVALVEQFIPLLMGAMGMIFVISQGSIDMSFGSNLAVCGMISLVASLTIGSWLFFPLAMVIGAGVGWFNGTIISKFKVSSFMVTIAMLITLRAIVQALMMNKVYLITPEIKAFNSVPVKLISTVVIIVVIYYLFEKSKFGRVSRAIGENEKAVRSAGINVDNYRIIAFVISGMFAGICGAFMLTRGGGANQNMGNMQELRIFMTMFIGGIPITGGMGTRVYKAVVGAALIALLENGLSLSGASGPTYEMVEGLILIGIIAVSLYLYNKTVHARDVTIV